MSYLSPAQFKQSREYIFKNGRLLERQLFLHFFEHADIQAPLNALRAYQNQDGGFGNGLEPDLLCPDSNPIGAETALYILDMLGIQPGEILSPLIQWIESQQTAQGTLPHPPEGLTAYPFQPWWANPDERRVLSLAGYLCKFAKPVPAILEKTSRYAATLHIPEPEDFYGYPHFIYLRYCGQNQVAIDRMEEMISHLPRLIETHHTHFPLFSRYWYHAADLVSNDFLEKSALAFIAALSEDGGLNTPYPDLPWWRPIFTLDGLILLNKFGFIDQSVTSPQG